MDPDGPGGTATFSPQTCRNTQAEEPLPPFASCLDVPERPTVNGLTWLLTCASLSQAEVRGHGDRGLAEEGRADGGKGVKGRDDLAGANRNLLDMSEGT